MPYVVAFVIAIVTIIVMWKLGRWAITKVVIPLIGGILSVVFRQRGRSKHSAAIPLGDPIIPIYCPHCGEVVGAPSRRILIIICPYCGNEFQ